MTTISQTEEVDAQITDAVTNNAPTNPPTVYWSPDEKVTISGVELASLIQLVDLQTVSLNQVPMITLFELFAQATKAKNDIMERLAAEGKLSSTPVQGNSEVELTAVPSNENLGEISPEPLV